MIKLNDEADPPPPRSSGGRFVVVASVGLALLVGVVTALAVVSQRNRLPQITDESLQAARDKWAANGPANYDIEVEVSGTRAATYYVKVRGGEPVSATHNGDPLPQARGWRTWSVPGMFGTISIDVKHSDPDRPVEDDEQRIEVTPQGEFDEKYGYPRRYRRIEWGSDVEASWEVTKFEVVRE